VQTPSFRFFFRLIPLYVFQAHACVAARYRIISGGEDDIINIVYIPISGLHAFFGNHLNVSFDDANKFDDIPMNTLVVILL
jgi:hypothetical protein